MPTTVVQPQYGAVATADKAAEYRMFFEKTLLEHAQHKLQLYDDAYQAEIPGGQGAKTIRMFRPPIADIANVITLTEGTPPSSAPYKLIYEFVTRTLAQFGGYAQVSDIVDETEFLNTGETLTKKFAEEAALWCDTLIRNACINGSTEEPTKFQKIYAGPATDFTTLGAQAASASTLVAALLLDCVTMLRLAKAPTFDDGFYNAVVSPEQEDDLIKENGTAWMYASAFNKPDQIYKGEIGNLSGIKVKRATNPMRQSGTEGTDVGAAGTIIAALIYGKDSFAVPKLSGESPASPKVNVISQPDSANPFGQFITYVWKTFFNSMCCNANFGITLQTKTTYAVP
jgi:N4-gp56 family major capsid protein